MIRFAYPNVRKEEFIGCGRYCAGTLTSSHPDGYALARPDTPSLVEIREVVAQFAQGTAATTQAVYEWKDRPEECYRGESLDLAYGLALLNCVAPLTFAENAGDLWCTGRIALAKNRPILRSVLPAGFEVKLQAFLAPANQDRVFLLPDANLDAIHRLQLNACPAVTILSVREFRPTALPDGKVIVTIRRDELPALLARVFPELRPVNLHSSGSRLSLSVVGAGVVLLLVSLFALIIGLTAGLRWQKSAPGEHLLMTLYDANAQTLSQTNAVYRVQPAEKVKLQAEFQNVGGARTTITFTPVRGRMEKSDVYRAPEKPGCDDIITVRVLERASEKIVYQDVIRLRTDVASTETPE